MKLTPIKIKEVLAAQIGVETEDLDNEDAFIEDLHMTNADLTDFGQKLQSMGADISLVDFSTIETIEELIEVLGL